ncbi:uncharacterized protein LOC112056252 isoform X2 [Bicyclus anynana]|nr:uncharacterized protein LOC112056252 isoform X2 [Bicyclus anynana]
MLTLYVADHIKEDIHQANKATAERVSKKSNLVKREPDGIIKVNNKDVSWFQWNGFTNKECTLCDVVVTTYGKHGASAAHMGNLTQSSVKCEGDMCYRQLNSNKFWCFTCTETFDKKLLSSHWDDYHNKNTEEPTAKPNKTKAIETFTENSNKTNTIKKKCDTNNNKTIVKDYIMKMLSESSTITKNYKVNIKEKTVLCLHCNTLVKPSFKALDKHIEILHPEAEVVKTYHIVDAGKRRHELAMYARENYIKLNKGGSKTFCSLCNIYISAHINCAKQHVEGSFHRGHLEIRGLVTDKKHEEPPVKPVPYKSFVKDVYGPFRIDEHYVKVLNDGICMDVTSFELIRFSYGFERHKGKCFGCDVVLDISELEQHLKQKAHRDIVLKCNVLLIPVLVDNEDFVREIRPGLYHCGYCNVANPFWENMAKHLRSFTHKVQRTKKGLLGVIGGTQLLFPHLKLYEIYEYNKLRDLDGFN